MDARSPNKPRTCRQPRPNNFVFYFGGKRVGKLRCTRCPVKAKGQPQCPRYVAVGRPLCAEHLLLWCGVEMAWQGEDMQWGLRVVRKIPVGTFIVPYGGVPRSVKDLREIYGGHTAPYALAIGDCGAGGSTLDSATDRVVGACANHDPVNFNGKFVKWPDCKEKRKLPGYLRQYHWWIQAVEDIQPGQWLNVNYGSDYVFDGVPHGTVDEDMPREPAPAAAAAAAAAAAVAAAPASAVARSKKKNNKKQSPPVAPPSAARPAKQKRGQSRSKKKKKKRE